MSVEHLLLFWPRRVGLALRYSVLASSLFATACTVSTRPPQADTANLGGEGINPVPGERVLVSRGNQWFPGTLVQPAGRDQWIVSYDGAGPEWNEAVTPDRLKPLRPVLAKDYRPGERTLVTARGRLFVADVLQQIGPEMWRVHYDGFGPEVVDEVDPQRMRRPYMGASLHAPNEPVTVEVNGQMMAGKIVVASAADRWVVRFDGYGAQYDQELGADKLRMPMQAPPPPVVMAPPPLEPAVKDVPGKKGKQPQQASVHVTAPPAPPPPLQIGDEVLVASRGVLAPAKLTGVGTNGRWKLRFDAAGSEEEEIAAEHVMRLASAAKNPKFAATDAVLIEWHGVFLPGKVINEAGHGTFRVRIDGRTPDDDEVVPAKRLRPRQ